MMVLGHNAAVEGNTGPGTTCANEMHFDMYYDPGAGSIVLPVDLQFSAFPLIHPVPRSQVYTLTVTL